MTAGVQSFEPAAAYLPAPPSQGKADGKGLGADPSEASDFQSEMDLQDAAPEPKSVGRAEKVSAKNTGKKQNTRSEKDDAAPATLAVIPAEIVEQKPPIVPITVAPVQPDETADDAPQANTSQGEASQEPVSQGSAPNNTVLQKNIVLQQTVAQNVIRAEEPSKAAPAPVAQKKLTPAQTEKTQNSVAILNAPASDSAVEAPDNVPANKVTRESPDPKTVPQTDPASAAAPVIAVPVAMNSISTNPAAPSLPQTYETQPVSQPELKVPELTPLEPAPAPATQKVDETPSSSPSALAFAARITAVQQPLETDSTSPNHPARPAPAPDVSAATRIPVRYAATAQVIPQITPQITPRAEQKSEGELESQVELRKYAGPALERSAPPDFFVPASPAATDTVKNFHSQPAAEPLPTPRTEHVIEPPAAPPASARDIRVQVPDNNGGSTQVRFLETGGEVRISVRTADTGLAQSLRSHLNDLSLRLAEGGVPAEIWKPTSSAAASQNDQHQPDREGRGSEGRQSGSNSGGHDGTQGDPQDQQERPAWLEEMEASLLARK